MTVHSLEIQNFGFFLFWTNVQGRTSLFCACAFGLVLVRHALLYSSGLAVSKTLHYLKKRRNVERGWSGLYNIALHAYLFHCVRSLADHNGIKCTAFISISFTYLYQFICTTAGNVNITCTVVVYTAVQFNILFLWSRGTLSLDVAI